MASVILADSTFLCTKKDTFVLGVFLRYSQTHFCCIGLHHSFLPEAALLAPVPTGPVSAEERLKVECAAGRSQRVASYGEVGILEIISMKQGPH